MSSALQYSSLQCSDPHCLLACAPLPGDVSLEEVRFHDYSLTQVRLGGFGLLVFVVWELPSKTMEWLGNVERVRGLWEDSRVDFESFFVVRPGVR
jgi:hypothetical protein